MVQDGIYNNHYFWILIMDGMTINHIVSIDHGTYPVGWNFAEHVLSVTDDG